MKPVPALDLKKITSGLAGILIFGTDVSKPFN